MVFPFLGKMVFFFCFFFLTLTRLLSLRSGEVERTSGLIYPRVLLNSYSYMRERDYDGDFLERTGARIVAWVLFAWSPLAHDYTV